MPRNTNKSKSGCNDDQQQQQSASVSGSQEEETTTTTTTSSVVVNNNEVKNRRQSSRLKEIAELRKFAEQYSDEDNNNTKNDDCSKMLHNSKQQQRRQSHNRQSSTSHNSSIELIAITSSSSSSSSSPSSNSSNYHDVDDGGGGGNDDDEEEMFNFNVNFKSKNQISNNIKKNHHHHTTATSVLTVDSDNTEGGNDAIQYRYCATYQEKQHQDHIWAVAFNEHLANLPPNHRQVFATAGDHVVNVYEIVPCTDAPPDAREQIGGALKVLHSYHQPKENFCTLDWAHKEGSESGGGTYLMAGGQLGMIHLFRHDTRVGVLRSHGCPIWHIKTNRAQPDLVCSAGEDRSIHLWNVFTRTLIAIFGPHLETVTCLAWHPTRPWLLSASLDGNMKMWDYSQDTPVGEAIKLSRQYTLMEHPNHDSGDPYRQTFPTFRMEGSIYSTTDVHRLGTMVKLSPAVDCVDWWDDMVLSRSTSGDLRLWLPGNKKMVIDTIALYRAMSKKYNKTANLPHRRRVHFVTNEAQGNHLLRTRFTLHRHLLAYGDMYGDVYLWHRNEVREQDLDRNKKYCTLLPSKVVVKSPAALTMQPVRAIAINPDATYMVVVQDKCYVSYYQLMIKPNYVPPLSSSLSSPPLSPTMAFLIADNDYDSADDEDDIEDQLRRRRQQQREQLEQQQQQQMEQSTSDVSSQQKQKSSSSKFVGQKDTLVCSSTTTTILPSLISSSPELSITPPPHPPPTPALSSSLSSSSPPPAVPSESSNASTPMIIRRKRRSTKR